jgi:hypothetical protein
MQGEATGSTDLPPPQLHDLVRKAYSRLASKPGFVATFARWRGPKGCTLASQGGNNSYTRSTAFLIGQGYHLPALEPLIARVSGKGICTLQNHLVRETLRDWLIGPNLKVDTIAPSMSHPISTSSSSELYWVDVGLSSSPASLTNS